MLEIDWSFYYKKAEQTYYVSFNTENLLKQTYYLEVTRP